MEKLLTAENAIKMTENAKVYKDPSIFEIKRVNKAIKKACKDRSYMCTLNYEISYNMKQYLENNGFIVEFHIFNSYTDIIWEA